MMKPAAHQAIAVAWLYRADTQGSKTQRVHVSICYKCYILFCLKSSSYIGTWGTKYMGTGTPQVTTARALFLLGPEWCRVKSWKLMQEEPSSTDNMAEAEQHWQPEENKMNQFKSYQVYLSRWNVQSRRCCESHWTTASLQLKVYV